MALDPLLGLGLFVFLVHACTLVLRSLGSRALARAVAVLGAAGIPLHELGHAIPALLFRMKIEEVDLLSMMPNGRGFSGHVTHRVASSAAGAVAVFCGPLVLALPAISFLGDVYAQQAAAGLDPVYLGGIFLVAVSVAMACTPSGADAGVLARAAGRFKGQAVVTLAGMACGAWMLWELGAPLAPWWWLLLDCLVVLGTGTACCMVYARLRPTTSTV